MSLNSKVVYSFDKLELGPLIERKEIKREKLNKDI
jgi:hypothetical protein